MSTRIQTRIHSEHVKFFRSRLTILDSNGIDKLIKSMDKEVHNIRVDIAKMCWYMRGGLTFTEGMLTSYQERQVFNEVIKNNLEVTKKSGMPFF